MRFEVDGLGMHLGGRAVLDGVRFAIEPGERVVLLGVNGSGKSTLLKLLDGLLWPTSGVVRYDGEVLDARAFAAPAFCRRFRGEVALLFQSVDAMLFNPTVADEIAFGPRQLRLPDIEGRVKRWAATFGVDGFLARAPFELSGGEKKRVALAALMAIEPKVLLLDEPTAGLDPASSARLVDLLSAPSGVEGAELPGLTVIASTHNLSVADELGARSVLLAPGGAGVLYDGPTAALLHDEPLLVRSGLAHRHTHRHGDAAHAHYHVHDLD